MAANEARRYLVAFATAQGDGLRVEVHVLAEAASPEPARVILTQGQELPDFDARSVRRGSVTCDAVFAVAAALLQEGAPFACGVTAGAGLVIDWRTVRCGRSSCRRPMPSTRRGVRPRRRPDVALAAVGELGKAAA